MLIHTFLRSHAIGICLIWPIAQGQYEIKYLCSVPSHRSKGVEECLIGLALKYCKGKGATRVEVRFDEEPIRQYQQDVLRGILTEKFGFSQI